MNTREECRGLFEIDTYATNAKHPNQVPEDQMITLKLMQTGSNWSKVVTAKTGQLDEDGISELCDLCGEMRETTDHCWYCPALKGKARQLDVELAEANPGDFTPAMRQGVACALNADPTRTFWGYRPDETWGLAGRSSTGAVVTTTYRMKSRWWSITCVPRTLTCRWKGTRPGK